MENETHDIKLQAIDTYLLINNSYNFFKSTFRNKKGKTTLQKKK